MAVYSHNGIILSNKNTNNLLLYSATWLDCTVITLSAQARHKRERTVQLHLYEFLA